MYYINVNRRAKQRRVLLMLVNMSGYKLRKNYVCLLIYIHLQIYINKYIYIYILYIYVFIYKYICMDTQ